MKLRNLFFTICAVLILTACGSSGGGGDTSGNGSNGGNDVVVGENTRVLTTDTITNDLLAISDDGNTLTFKPSAEIDALKVGDVIVAGYSEATPVGFMKTVTKKTLQDGDVVLDTEPAALADVFESASFSASEPLPIDGNDTVTTDIADGVTFEDVPNPERMVIDIVSKQITLDNMWLWRPNPSEDKGVKIVGTFRPTLSVDLDWDIDDHSLQMLKVAPRLTGEFDAHIEASVTWNTNNDPQRVTLFTEKTTRWYLIGYVPVCVVYKVPFYLTFSGEAKVGVEAGGAVVLTGHAGFLYEKSHGISLINDLGATADWLMPTVFGELTTKFGPSIGAKITVDGCASSETILNSGAKIQLRSEISADACTAASLLVNYAYFYNVTARANFTVFDKTLWESKEIPIIDDIEFAPSSQTLAQSNSNPVPAIDFPATNELYTGNPVHFTSNATDPDGQIVSYLWDFGDGTTSTSANPAHIYQSSGTYNFSLTVKDNDGCPITEERSLGIDDPVAPIISGEVSGSVRDAASHNDLENVSVTAYLNNSTVATATTNSSGNFTMSLPKNDGYTFQFARSGFLTSVYSNINILEDESLFLEAVLQINNEYAGNGQVAGKITNALTGQGVSGVSVSMRQGINVTSGEIVKTVQTGSAGTYSVDSLPAGHYTAQLSRDGYTSGYVTIVCLGSTTNDNQNGSITPVLSADEVRVILTWGASPSDLDSHLTLPSSSDYRLHVYYVNKSVDGANLDVDDTSSYGPETITITAPIGGVARYSVHDFSNKGSSNSSELGASGAKVEVYRGSNMIARFNVPNQAGTLWTVFELDDGALKSVNSMGYESNEGNIRALVASPALLYDKEIIRNQLDK